MNRIMLAGTHSGCGKTTVTCALLAALKKRELSVAAFKCGPDYIDPMFHRRAIGVPSRNLDPFFCTAAQLRGRIAAQNSGIAVIEGVMGYYDGVGAEGHFSAYDVARGTQTPVVLVVDAKGMHTSAGAVLKGFAEYKPQSSIAGVVFNNTPPGLYGGLCAVAESVGVKPFGFLPREAEASVKSRHLGLVTAGELTDIEQKLETLGTLAERHLDIDGLLALAAKAPALAVNVPAVQPLGHVRVAVARDEAFCFLYEENLERLAALGCELCFFSPLRDAALPGNIGGLYLCGGYPELYTDALFRNEAMRNAVRTAIENKLPTIAECGGFLYLHDTLDGIPMAGVIHAAAYKTEKLSRFGYLTLHAQGNSLVCAAGESIRAHEFHYYDSTDNGAGFRAEKPYSQKSWLCVHTTPTLYAGFPHLYFDANPAFAANFVRSALDYSSGGSLC